MLLDLIKPFHIMHQKLFTLLFLREPFLVACLMTFQACLCWRVISKFVAWSMRQAFLFSSGIPRIPVCYCTMQRRIFWKWGFLVIYGTACVSLVVGTMCSSSTLQNLRSSGLEVPVSAVASSTPVLGTRAVYCLAWSREAYWCGFE